MDIKQQSRLKMFLAVRDFLLANTTITALMPNFTGFYNSLVAFIAQIITNSELQNYDKTGINDTKLADRTVVIGLGITASDAMTAYAKYAKIPKLTKEVSYCASDFTGATDSELHDIVQGLYDKAQTNLAVLTPYSITAATQTAFLAAITTFVAAIPTTREGIIANSQYTALIKSGFVGGNLALNNIDVLAKVLQFSQAPFFAVYTETRVVVYPAGGSNSMRGLALDSITGLPIVGAKSTISLLQTSTMKEVKDAVASTPVVVMIKKTAKKGRYNVKGLVDGIYQITTTKFGYVDHVATVVINKGELTVHTMMMVKV